MKTTRLFETILLMVLTCANFCACSSDDEGLTTVNVHIVDVDKKLFTDTKLMYKITTDHKAEVVGTNDTNDDVGSLHIPENIVLANNTYKITSIDSYAFRYCQSLTAVTIPSSVTSIGEDAFSLCENLTSINIPNSVTSIGEDAFYSCRNLTSITLPDHIEKLEYGILNGCSNLTSVTIPNSVTDIRDLVFFDCDRLTSITIPNSVTSTGYDILGNGYYINSITIGSSLTSLNGFVHFDFPSLTSITVDKDNPNYCSVDGVLFNKDKTTLLRMPENRSGKYTIPSGVTTLNDHAFYNSIISSVTIPNSVTQIENSTFCGCTNLTSINIPNNVTQIGDYSFGNCTALTTVTIPGCVTSIGEYAFGNCTHLTSVTIPSSVTSIGNELFYNCIALNHLYIKATTPPAVTLPYYGESTCLGGEDSAILHVPAGCKDIYSKTFPWSKYKNIVEE